MGRLTWRPRITSCWRRKAFSATSAAFVLAMSLAALPTHGPVAGLVHGGGDGGPRAARPGHVL
ncbi:MAG: hypothetical protein AVDCRST_MAG88-1924 [uncultured Thermomicrobiales bacterium]|uniref:Uncharacterized protein n=1 Tax=uncultured Thermomicrobiales bacterium TaxID=1645740 RepID=A0A6J4V3M7_9BACT|nr:MAG: hypothetical protein AVDCRST_MAG88-1924 [uncultured Thermomicrobiales bacterium]